MESKVKTKVDMGGGKGKASPVKMTKKQKENMERALGNHLIVDKIVKGLEFTELKIGRRINKTWKNFCSKEMLDRDCCVIQMDKEDKMFYRVKEVVRNGKNVLDKTHHLKGLNEILEKATNFPCSHFEFKEFLNLEEEVEVKRFFHIYGSFIKTLELGNDKNTKLHGPFAKLLQPLVPNLVKLHVSKFGDFSWTLDEKEKILYPSLKKFSWENSPVAALQILQSAPNLDNIPRIEFSSNSLESLRVSGTGDLVQKLCCHSGNKNKWSEFVRLGPKLQSIRIFSIGNIPEEELRPLQRIIESSKETVESLLLSRSYEGIVLPTLTKLTTLELIDHRGGSRLFQPRINLEEIFPHLQILDCMGLDQLNIDEEWEELFPPPDAYRGRLTTVKTIKIHPECTELNMCRLANLCPNFKSTVSKDRSTVLGKVFKLWTHLESLEFEDVLCGPEDYFLDADITGMSKETCDRLLTCPDDGGEETFVTGPSILNLKGLRMFKIGLLEKPVRPFSLVSGIYAFKLMPDLKVVVQFDHEMLDNCDLTSFYEEFSSFVNIRHEKRS